MNMLLLMKMNIKIKAKVRDSPPPPPLDNFNKLLKLGTSKEAINHKMKMEKKVINPKDLQSVKLKKLLYKDKRIITTRSNY